MSSLNNRLFLVIVLFLFVNGNNTIQAHPVNLAADKLINKLEQFKTFLVKNLDKKELLVKNSNLSKDVKKEYAKLTQQLKQAHLKFNKQSIKYIKMKVKENKFDPHKNNMVEITQIFSDLIQKIETNRMILRKFEYKYIRRKKKK